MIDPLHERFTLSEFLLGADGEYEYGVHTDAVFATERPWQITIDLPALTERHTALLGRAKPGE